MLTAAAEGQEALEITKLGHGVFTSAQIDALHHARIDKNGYILVSNLAEHVQDLVPKLISGGEGRSAIPRGPQGGESQSAHFGTTGSDFALVKRLTIDETTPTRLNAELVLGNDAIELK